MSDGAALKDCAAVCLDVDAASSHHTLRYTSNNSSSNGSYTHRHTALVHASNGNKMERQPQRRYAFLSDIGLSLLPGVAQGATTVLLGHPLDTAKTRMQTLGPHVQQSSFRTMYAMVSTEGVRSLYRGVTPPLVMQGIKRGVQFAFWDLLRRPNTNTSNEGSNSSTSSSEPVVAVQQEHRVAWRDKLHAAAFAVRITLRDNPFLAGAAAGGFGTLLGCPMHVVKIQTQSQTSATTRNAWTCTLDIARKDGLRGYYRGFKFHLLKDMCFAGSYLGSYGALTRWLLASDAREMTTCFSARAERVSHRGSTPSVTHANVHPNAVFAQEEDMSSHGGHEEREDRAYDLVDQAHHTTSTSSSSGSMLRLSPNMSAFIAGAGASMLTWTLFYPLDTLKTIMQAKQAQLLRRIRRDPRLLYRGLVASLIRAGPVSGVAMMMYEMAQRKVDARRAR